MNETEILRNSLACVGIDNDDNLTENKLLRNKLIVFITKLINNDFSKLMQLLYRIDVNEQKLKNALALNPDTNPAEIVTDMIISRQREKLKWRKWYQNKSTPH